MANIERTEIEKFAFSIAGSSLLRGEFQSGLKVSPEGLFVPQPKALSKIQKARKSYIQLIQEQLKLQRSLIKERSTQLKQADPGLNTLSASDLAIQSISLEDRLAEQGVFFGERIFNYAVPDLRLPKETVDQIELAAETAFRVLKNCRPATETFNPTEKYLEEIGLEPNCARVDVILTQDGPKVIEINSQWVDGIQALEGLQVAYLGQRQKISPVEELARCFDGKSRLALVDITRGAGSRSAASKLEIEYLAKNLQTRDLVKSAEVIDPKKVATDYLKNFDAYYVNGDPRMITTETPPEWLRAIYDRAKDNPKLVAPRWRPGFDKKSVLIEASQKSDFIVPTWPFEPDLARSLSMKFSEQLVLKGDSYSSASVAMAGTELFDNLMEDATQFPAEYVLQPTVMSAKLAPAYGIDTSSKKIAYLENPRSKFNVWIINNKCVGIMCSLSNQRLISDKDFNIVPKTI